MASGRQGMILSIGLLYTSAMRLAFLGPVGTYGERAARRLASLAGHAEAELVPQQGIRAVIQSLATAQCDAAVVPVEN
jgi:prephenate dehydratase